MTAWLVGLMAIAGPLVISVLVSLGIGYVSYTGADFVISEAESYVFSNYNAMPVDMYLIATIAGFDEGLKIIFAAAAAQISIKTSLGVFSKFKTGAAP